MWMAHALFWPVLALCLFAPMNARGGAAVAVTLCALVLTHGGAIVLTLSILFALFLRGGWDRRFMRACIAFGIAMLIWIALRFIFPPDDYFAPVLHTAAFKFIDVRNLAQPAVLTIVVTLAGYACLIPVLRTAGIARPHFPAVLACIAALAVFWIGFDRWVLSEARYDVRTALLIGIPILGLFATLQTMSTKNWLRSPLSFVRRWHETVLRSARPSALIGALTLVVIVHVYETGKFVLDWTQYKAAVRALATSTASDPQLGSPLFVSSDRIASDLDRLEWNSTTPFLSVLVTPSLTPTRLVVDPAAGYFWLSCRTARESEAASTAIPEPARRLIRLHACLHRPD